MRIPLLAPLAAFAGGVWTARLAAFDSEQALLAAVVSAGLGLAGLFAPRRGAGRAAVLCAVVMTGIALGSLRLEPAPDRVDLALGDALQEGDLTVRLRGWVRRPPSPLEGADQFVLEAESAFGDRLVSGGVLATVNRTLEDPPLELRYGERVEFLARLRTPRNYGNPGAFDRVGWLAEQGIYLTATVRPRTPLLISEGRGDWLDAQLWTVRQGASRRLDRLEALTGRVGSAGAGIVRAMTLGDSRDIDVRTRSQFESSGTYHVLVVSGMHVGLLAALSIALIRATGLSITLAWATGAAVAFCYALLLDSDLPVSRAAWMLAAYLAASALYRRRQSLNVICGVALAFLCWEPGWIADAGFQLSFLSVAAIAAIGAPLVERVVRPRQLALKDVWNMDRDLRLPVEIVVRRVAIRDWVEPISGLIGLPKTWASVVLLAPLRLFWGAVAGVLVSAVITLVLAAPLAYHFQRLALAGPLANLAVLPALAVIAPAGFAALLTGWAWPYGLAATAADLLAWCVAWVGSWDALERFTAPPGGLSIAVALGSCAYLAWALERGRRQRWAATIAAVGCGVVIAVYPFGPEVAKGRLELTAIDVGQGEALMIGLPDGSAGLVDAGGFPNFRSEEPSAFDVGERIVAPYLGSRGLKRLAFLAITHGDADHMAGAISVLRRFRPGELWLPRYVLGGEFRPLLEAAREERVTVRFLRSAETFEVAQAGVEALFCEGCEQRNDRSLVLAFDFGEHRFLLTGDIEAEGEKDLVAKLDGRATTVLKTPHHGSRNSTSALLLERTRPAAAIVSAGYQNLYGHPHAEVIGRLEKRRVFVLRTDRDGAATVSTDGKRLALSGYLD